MPPRTTRSTPSIRGGLSYQQSLTVHPDRGWSAASTAKHRCPTPSSATGADWRLDHEPAAGQHGSAQLSPSPVAWRGCGSNAVTQRGDAKLDASNTHGGKAHMYQTDQYEGMIAETVSMRGHNGDVINAYVARPLGAGPFPGMVVIHHAPGWDEWYRECPRRFAHHGYVSISPNLYSRDGHGSPEDVGAKVRAAGGAPDARVLGDLDGANAWLRSLPYVSRKVGIFGTCSSAGADAWFSPRKSSPQTSRWRPSTTPRTSRARSSGSSATRTSHPRPTRSTRTRRSSRSTASSPSSIATTAPATASSTTTVALTVRSRPLTAGRRSLHSPREPCASRTRGAQPCAR